MKVSVFNNRLKQIILLGIIILIGIMLISQISMFIPGILGAITLYILCRKWYFKLIFQKKWKRGIAAGTFVILCLIIIAIPIYLTVEMVGPKVKSIIANKEQIIQKLQITAKDLSEATGITMLSPEKTQQLTQKLSSYVPGLVNSTTAIITNLAVMFFLFYFLLDGGRELEKNLHRIIPLKEKNIHILASETKMMIKANALGIPVICIIQGITAAIGYAVFGVEEWALWGFLTGIFAFFPIVGTMVVWVPLTIYMYSQGNNGAALGLLIYSVVVTGNVDYLARLTFLKKFGDVHPLITVFGVIIGLNFFGFVGLIFGPLLISYFLILIKIYINEFSDEPHPELLTETIEDHERAS